MTQLATKQKRVATPDTPVQIDESAAPSILADESVHAALRVAAVWTPIFAAVFCAGLYALSSAIVAADLLLHQADSSWDNAMIPLALFLMYGLGFGAFLGWRMSSSAGLVGRMAFGIGTVASVVVVGVGIIAAFVIFTHPLPTLAWVALGVMFCFALPGVAYYSLWME